MADEPETTEPEVEEPNIMAELLAKMDRIEVMLQEMMVMMGPGGAPGGPPKQPARRRPMMGGM